MLCILFAIHVILYGFDYFSQGVISGEDSGGSSVHVRSQPWQRSAGESGSLFHVALGAVQVSDLDCEFLPSNIKSTVTLSQLP